MGQAVNGTLLGTVTDATGAAVPNAKVMIKETSTSLTHESIDKRKRKLHIP